MDKISDLVLKVNSSTEMLTIALEEIEKYKKSYLENDKCKSLHGMILKDCKIFKEILTYKKVDFIENLYYDMDTLPRDHFSCILRDTIKKGDNNESRI